MKNKYPNFLFVIALLFALVAINTTGGRDVIRRFVFDVSRPILVSANFFFYNCVSGVRRFADVVEGYKEHESLKQEVQDLRFQLVRFEEVKKENERLKALVNFQKDNELAGISAEIIGRDMSAFSDHIILNQGKADGVNMGTVLISHEGLVGHVVSVGEHHARALLMTDIKARVCVVVQESREAGVVEGTPGGLLKLKHLNINSSIKVGDVVVTSGFGDIYPKGIPVGKVAIIATEKNNLSLYALVKPFVDFSKLEEVLCLRNK